MLREQISNRCFGMFTLAKVSFFPEELPFAPVYLFRIVLVLWLLSRVHCHMASPACHPGLTLCRRGVNNSGLHFEATCRFAFAATRRLARLPFGAFVRKLSALGYPLHLPQATWRTNKFPRSDFNRQVICFTRHALLFFSLKEV